MTYDHWKSTESDDGAERPIPDPRNPNPNRTGIFTLHNCWRCKDGTGNPRQCEYPHARND